MSTEVSQLQQNQVVTADEDDYNEWYFAGDEHTVNRKRTFIEELRRKATFYHAAQAAGISRKTGYVWIERDPAFAAACEDAREDTVDILETSVYERALGNSEQGIKGDSLLAMFWLKAHRPKFRDRVSIDLNEVQAEIQQRIASVPALQLPASTTPTPSDDDQS
jgi:hypothetical protein